MQKMLNNLYKGYVLVSNNNDKSINLSDLELTQPPHDFLNSNQPFFLNI